jgi:PAS domain S-box-containing protein
MDDDMGEDIIKNLTTEKDLYTLFEKALVGIYVIQDDVLKYVNPYFCRMLGYTRDELTGMKALDIVHPEDRQMVGEAIEKRIKGEIEEVHYTPRFLTKDGKTVYTEALGVRVCYDKRPAILGTLIDVTRYFEEREEQMRLNEILLTLRNINQIIAREKDRTKLIETACRIIFSGLRCGGVLLSTPYGNFLYRGDNVVYVDVLPPCVGKERVLECPHSSCPFEWCRGVMNVAFDYKGIHASLSLFTSVFYPTEFLKEVVDDIAVALYSLKLEDELRWSEVKFRSIFQQSDDGMAIVDEDGKIIEVNEKMGEIVGKNIEGMWVHEVFNTSSDEFKSCDRVFQLFSFPVEIGKKKLRVIRLTDITAEKEKEVLQEKLAHADRLAIAGTLAGGVIHEINNPLSVITLNLPLLREARGDEKEEIIRDMEEATQRIQNIVKDLLEFVKRDRGIGDVDLKDVVESSLRILSHKLKNVVVKCELENVSVSAHRGKLEQVVINIVDNAIWSLNQKYPEMNENKILRIRTYKEGDNAIIEIEDRGIGMSEDVRKRIFDPFFTTKEEGTGLGMWVVYNIVKTHGGEISIESKEGEGAKFIITLPTELPLQEL